MRLFLVLLAVIALALISACSAGAPAPASTSTPPSSSAPSQAPPSVTPSPAPSPSGLVLHVLADFTANDQGGTLKWSPKTLSAPTDQAFQIAMKVPNDAIHNLWVEDGKGKALFKGGDGAHGTTTYDIPALKAGTYYFVCTYHRLVMTGVLTVH
ncbi:MAG: cupredoxin domain-containing protein [Chloroflexota bacterium]|nr:cupredoxin domain-containing protein [Chloroflexota bacterium]